MVETVIDLTAIQFLDSDKPLFDGAELQLGSKNFIFAKNGSGKSTLSNAIAKQKDEEYDVQIFKGFDGIIGEKDNFDAFSLAVDAGKKEAEIKVIEKEIEQKNAEKSISEKNVINPDEGIENFYSRLQSAENTFNEQKSKLNRFCTHAATVIVNSQNPNLVANPRGYNKNTFKKEIQEAKKHQLLQDSEIDQLKEILKSNSSLLSQFSFQNINLLKYLKSVNEILSSKVEEHTKITRLNNQAKINFAKEGLNIHKEGEICAFCGNGISYDTVEELEKYFSADEVKVLQSRIEKGKSSIKSQIEILRKIHIPLTNYYPSLIEEVSLEISNIEEAKQLQIEFLEELYSALDDKDKDLFSESKIKEIPVPKDIDFTQLNKLIEKHNQFSKNLENEKENARKKLRYNEINKLLNDFNYELEVTDFNNLNSNLTEKKTDFDFEKNKIENLEQIISNLEAKIELLKPKAEKQAIDRINKKLRLKVAWELDFFENEDSGYYMVREGDRTRSVKRLSTGEKNIIAFLYFIEKLEEVRENQDRKPRLIIFDDPMSSNDDTMQYLIIGELQRLYQGKEKKKYSGDKDILVILTHNVHFYLNVQPHGNFKDKNQKTKYDKNNFYRIDNHKFIKVMSEKEDFKTSYEALWIELKDLYECGHENSMLNSMRRIIETYMQFNCLKQDEFYKGNEQYLKLFNVHSHSIDDYSAESYTENKEDMKNLFYQIFKDNDCERHFKKYWEI